MIRRGSASWGGAPAGDLRNCRRIGTRNKQFYFSVNKDKKTRLIYLGNQREPLARRLSKNYKELLAIVEEMTALNMDLLKSDALE
jgi:hypothetical protein